MTIGDVSTSLEVEEAVLLVVAEAREGQDQRWC